MGLNIKNPQTETLARELAAITGETVTGAITTAVRDRLERLRGNDERRREVLVDQLMKIARDAGPRWREPYRSTPHGELLYDEQGLPQ
jgi:antitoxin VapB